MYDKTRYLELRNENIARAKKHYWDDPSRKARYDISYRPRKNELRRERWANDDQYRESILVSMRGLPSRRRTLKNKYGITIEQFAERLLAQGEKCACCGAIEPKGKGTWCLDHDHLTGEIRGILCHTCNVGIGGLGDTLGGVLNAVVYLDTSAHKVDEHY